MIERTELRCLFIVFLLAGTGASAQSIMPDTIYVSRSIKQDNYPGNHKLYLGENNPDPFYDSIGTTIKYGAIDAKEAWIIVYNATKIPIAYYRLPASHGEVEIVNRKWPRGEYTYALFVDGRLIRKRKMTAQ